MCIRDRDKEVLHEYWSANPRLLRDISVATRNWPAHRLIYNAARQIFEVGGGTLDRCFGSAPSQKWPTDHFVSSVYASSGRTMSDPI